MSLKWQRNDQRVALSYKLLVRISLMSSVKMNQMTSKGRIKMSGNYKPRAKSEEEKAHDAAMVIEKTDKCISSCTELVEELSECGDAWLGTVRNARIKC